MSSTRIRNDPVRIQKEMDIFTFGGKYMLDVPGPGNQLPYFEDPHVRLQHWGGNRHSNINDIDADLKGYTKKISRDYLGKDEYKHFSSNNEKIEYPKYQQAVTDESRAVCPAFLFRGMDVERWEEPFINPQANIEIPFNWGIQTRILEKDAVFNKMNNNDDNNDSFIDSSMWLPIQHKT